MITRFIAAILFVSIARADTAFYVAPTGNDSNAGTEAAPFATIERAQHAVREAITGGLTGNVRVILRAGTFELANPLVFGPQDTGAEQFSVTYEAQPGEKVVISGGRRISNWSKETGSVWTAKVPEGWYFRNLYVNDHRAIRARTPNVTDKEPRYKLKGFDKKNWVMTLGEGQVSEWKNLSDVEAVIFGTWSIIRKPIQSAEPAKGMLTLKPPYFFASGFEPNAGTPFYLENARKFLDQPGEWYLDRATSLLSYWPRSDEDLSAAEVVAPRLTSLLEVNGTGRQPVRNLHFTGLHFCHADAGLPAQGYIGGSHGYARSADYPKTKAWERIDVAVAFQFTQGCSFEAGEIAHVGGNALQIDKGCSQFAARGNRIDDVGDIGIIFGFDRTSRGADGATQTWPTAAEESRDNQITENEVFDCGATYHDGCAMFIRFGSNTLIAHNLIHDCPHHGISVATAKEALPRNIATGYRIENNDIYQIGTMLTDVGGIYFWGRQGSSCVITGNVLHDMRAYGAIYFDDETGGHEIAQNVIYNIAGRSISFFKNDSTTFIVHDNYFQSTNDYVKSDAGYGLRLTGDRVLDVPHQESLEPAHLTLVASVKLSNFPAGNDPAAWIACKNTNEFTAGNYALLVSHDNVGAYLNLGGGRENCYGAWSLTGPLKIGVWHRVAMTFDGKDLRVFCDGQPMGATTVGRARTAGNAALRIGKRGDGYNPSFPGLIGDIRLYDRALSTEELQTVDSKLPGLVLNWNANNVYSEMERILQNAGPRRPQKPE